MLSRFILFLLLTHSHLALAAVLVKVHQWPQNSQLNVVFLDGSTKAQSLVKKYSVLWLKNTNLSFRFFNSIDEAPSTTHIRVSFKLHSGSQLGNQNDHFSKTATMNLFDLKSNQISGSGIRRLILHEFGHALGLEHEYRNPDWPGNKEVIFKIINECLPKMAIVGYPNKIAKERCVLINKKLKAKDVLSTAYDETSVMNYAFQFVDRNNNKTSIKAQSILSFLDKYAIQKWYPTNE